MKSKQSSNFNILQFLLVYALLAGWFYCFIGITSPGGNTYSPILDHYFNAPRWLTWLIAKSSMAMLRLAGFTVYQRSHNNVTIMGSRGVTIIWACLGFGVMSFWTAFVTAHKATRQYKLKWCLSGIAIIIALNITRITLIAVANHYHWLSITSLEPHATFNIASYILLFLLVVWFIRRYKKDQKDKSCKPLATSCKQEDIQMAVES
jgi:exosortase/archaeosortase family protein